MGADLYINSLYEANSEKWRKIFEELAETRDTIYTQGQVKMWTDVARNNRIEKLTNVRVQVTASTDKAMKRIEKGVDQIIDRLRTFTKPKHFNEKRCKAISDAIQKMVSIASDEMYSVGYFRESYGGGGVLNRLGLSWWQDFGKVVNKQGFVSPRGAQKFLKILQQAKFAPIETYAKEKGLSVDDKSNSLAAWDKHHKARKKELEKFLQTAIDLKEPIRASI